MANTYVAIATVTVGSGGAADITFSSIPATYTDLCLVYSARTTLSDNSQNLRLQMNGDTGNNYSYRRLYGDGSSAASDSGSSQAYILVGLADAATSTSNTFSNGQIYIPNYAGSNYKSTSSDAVSENNATLAYAYLIAGLWSSTSAITSLKFYAANNFAEYSTATLYGIKNS